VKRIEFKEKLCRRKECIVKQNQAETQKSGSSPTGLNRIPFFLGWVNWCSTSTDEECIEAGIGIASDKEKYQRVNGDDPEDFIGS
jgi:hypothetical protein